MTHPDPSRAPEMKSGREELCAEVRRMFGRAIEEDGRLCDAADSVDDLCDAVVARIEWTFALLSRADTPAGAGGDVERQELEAAARRIAARKCGLSDPTGSGLPEDIWWQALPEARAALSAQSQIAFADAIDPNAPWNRRRSKLGVLLLDAANGHPCSDPELAREAGAAMVNSAAALDRAAAPQAERGE